MFRRGFESCIFSQVRIYVVKKDFFIQFGDKRGVPEASASDRGPIRLMKILLEIWLSYNAASLGVCA